MSDKLRESVSALMDGEGDDLELRRLLAAADQPDVRDAWRDFHIQRDSLAGLDIHYADIDISKRVWAALAAEPALAPSPAPVIEAAAPAAGAPAVSRWWRPLTSVAVAASVAALVVVGVRGLDGSTPAPVAGGVADVQPTLSAESLANGAVDPAASAGAAAVTVSAENETALLPADAAELELEAEMDVDQAAAQ